MGVMLLLASVLQADTAYEQAKQRLQDALTKRVALPIVTWSAEELPVADDASGTIYLLSESWCGACPAAKRNAEVSGIPHEIISVNRARQLGLVSGRITIPRLVHSQHLKQPLIGAVSATRMNAWAEQFPSDETALCVIADVHTPFSVDNFVAALVAHLVRAESVNEIPEVGGLFNADLSVPSDVPRIITQLLDQKPIQIPRAGLEVTWLGDDRTVEFRPDGIAFNPPVSLRVSKWRVSVTTTLSRLIISDGGRKIRCSLKGPDFVIRFRAE